MEYRCVFKKFDMEKARKQNGTFGLKRMELVAIISILPFLKCWKGNKEPAFPLPLPNVKVRRVASSRNTWG